MARDEDRLRDQDFADSLRDLRKEVTRAEEAKGQRRRRKRSPAGPRRRRSR